METYNTDTVVKLCSILPPFIHPMTEKFTKELAKLLKSSTGKDETWAIKKSIDPGSLASRFLNRLTVGSECRHRQCQKRFKIIGEFRKKKHRLRRQVICTCYVRSLPLI